MARKTGLGRGLDALIPSSEPSPESGVSQIPLERILPNPRQPRVYFDKDELKELADSIHEHGVIQPLILSQGEQPGSYILIAGERRLEAARLAGLKVVPALLREVSDQERLELALIENIQRTDLAPLEAAEAYRQLVVDFGLTQEEIAARVGKSRESVANKLRLLKLPPTVSEALAEGRISEGHARALQGLSTPQAQANTLRTVENRKLSVRQTEALVRRLNGETTVARPKPTLSPEIQALEDDLRHSLETKVTLNHRGKAGTIIIHYEDDEMLTALYERLTGKT